LKNEYYNGSESNRRLHYKDVGLQLYNNQQLGQFGLAEDLEGFVEDSMAKELSIHFHVWNCRTFLTHLKKAINDGILNIEPITFAKQGIEFVVLFRKL